MVEMLLWVKLSICTTSDWFCGDASPSAEVCCLLKPETGTEVFFGGEASSSLFATLFTGLVRPENFASLLRDASIWLRLMVRGW